MWKRKNLVDLKTLEKLKVKANSALGGGKDVKAIKFNREIIKYGRELGEEGIGHVAGAHIALAGSALADKEYRQAGEHYKESIRLYKKAGDENHVRIAESKLAKMAEERGSLGNRLLGRGGFAIAVIGFLGSVFFMTNSFTGYVIRDISQKSSNLFGVVLFFIGIIGLYFWMQKN